MNEVRFPRDSGAHRLAWSVVLTLILTASVASGLDHSGTCTGTFLVADNPHRLTGTCTVPVGQTLTLQPGVVLNGQNNSVQVSGTLTAVGTMGQPVAFNNVQVVFAAGSGGEIRNSTLTPPTSSAAFESVNISNASPVLSGNRFTEVRSGGTLVAVGGTSTASPAAPTITGNTFEESATNGVAIDYSGTARGVVTGNTITFVAAGTGNRVGIRIGGAASPLIDANTIGNDAARTDTGIFVNVTAASSVQVVNNDICSTGSDTPLNVSLGVFANTGLATVSGNVLSCGPAAGIAVSGTAASATTLAVVQGQSTLRQSGTWTINAGAAVVIPTGLTLNGVGQQITVNGALTLQPGVVLNGQNSTVQVSGTLTAVGTMGQPVAFNNVQVVFAAGSGGQIRNSTLTPPTSSTLFESVNISDASPALTGNRFTELRTGGTLMSVGGASTASPAAPTISGNTFEESASNGIAIDYSGTARGVVTGNTITFVAAGTGNRVGIRIGGAASPLIDANTIGNDAARTDTGIFVNVTAASSVQVVNNDICSTGSDTPLNVSLGVFANTGLATVSGNVLSCGPAAGIAVSGTAASATTLAVVQGQSTLRQSGTWTINAGAAVVIPTGLTLNGVGQQITVSGALTLQPGVVLNGQNSTVQVSGTLTAVGTMGQPVAFNNVQVVFAAGSGGQIRNSTLTPPTSSTLFESVNISDASPALTGNRFTELRTGGTLMSVGGASTASPAAPTISGNTFEESASNGIAIDYSGTARGVVTGNTITFVAAGTGNRVGIRIGGAASPLIDANTIGNDAARTDTGIFVNVTAASSVQVVNNDICSTGSDTPLNVSLGVFANTGLATVSGNVLSCGPAAGIAVSGTAASATTLAVVQGQSTLRQSGTWTINAGAAVVIPTGLTLNGVGQQITVNGALTLQPGVVLNGQNSTVQVSGTLTAVGTMGQPVAFNNVQVVFAAGSGGQIRNSTLTPPTSSTLFESVNISDASPALTGNRFTELRTGGTLMSVGGASTASPAAPTISGNTFEESASNGIAIDYSGTARGVVTGNTITFVAAGTGNRVGIRIGGAASPLIDANTIGNDAARTDTGIFVNVTAASSVQVVNNDICSTGSDTPLNVSLGVFANTGLATVSGNVLSCGPAAGIAVSGTAASATTLAVVQGQSTLRQSGTWTINAGAAVVIPTGLTLNGVGQQITVNGALTLQPGVVLNGQNSTVQVSGTLTAVGTMGQPVAFNNVQVVFAAGSGGQIRNSTLTPPTSSTLFESVNISDASPALTGNRFTELRTGGTLMSVGGASTASPAAPTISGNTFEESASNGIAIDYSGTARGLVTGNTVVMVAANNGARVGIRINGAASPVIDGNTVGNDPARTDTGIFVNVTAASSVQVVNNDICSTGGDTPIALALGFFNDPMLATVGNNTLSCGVAAGFSLPGGNLSAATSLISIDGQTTYRITSMLTIGATGRLTIPPGFTLIGQGTTVNVDGTLIATQATLVNVLLALHTSSSASRLVDSTLSSVGSAPVVTVTGSAPTLMGNTFLGGATALAVNGGAPLIAGNTFAGFTTAVTLTGTTTALITGNTFLANGLAIRVASAAPRVTVDGNSFDQNTASLSFPAADSLFGAFPAMFPSNVFLGDHNDNAIPLPSQLNSSGTLRSVPVPYVAAGLTIPPGVTVVVEPGTVIQSTGGGSITVDGRLLASGQPERPIVFTSTSVRSGVGARWRGLVFNNQPLATGSVLDWCIVEFTGTVTPAIILNTSDMGISNCRISDNANNGVELRGSSRLQLTNTAVVMNLGDGMFVRDPTLGAPTVVDSSIFGNGGFGLRTQSLSPVIAEHNFWGDDSGPLDGSDDRSTGGLFNPTGLGEQVSNFVDYDPWIRLGPGLAGTISGISGGAQMAPVGTCLPDPLVVEILSTLGSPLQGIDVIFSVVSGDASIVEDQPVRSAIDGRAQVTLCLGSTAGLVMVAVTARDVNSPFATFMPTAEPAGPCLFGVLSVALPGRECPGDCDADGAVTVDEMLVGVRIALGELPMSACESLDRSDDGAVTIDDVLSAVGRVLDGCPEA